MNPSTGFRSAFAQAQLSDHGIWKLGASLWRSRAQLAVGHNRSKNDPALTAYEHCSVHAEIDALNQVVDASGTVLYVARLTRSGLVSMARPCLRCMEAITDAGVKKVVYTVNTHQFGIIKVAQYAECDYEAEEIFSYHPRIVKSFDCGRAASLGRLTPKNF